MRIVGVQSTEVDCSDSWDWLAMTIAQRSRAQRCAMRSMEYDAQTKKVTQQEEVLLALRDGARTWEELQNVTRISDDQLGLALAELFAQRRVQTGHKGGVRVYKLARSSA